jgi:hypothetical protein
MVKGVSSDTQSMLENIKGLYPKAKALALSLQRD